MASDIVLIYLSPESLWQRWGESFFLDQLPRECRGELARGQGKTRGRERLLSRALAGASIAHVRGKASNTIHLHRSPHGRPQWADGASLEFNVSHSRDLMVCALADLPHLGIDVEHKKRRVNLDVARRFFSARETAWLEALPPWDQAGAFLRLWTLKEAYVKAVGEGMARVPLDQFDFDLAKQRFQAHGRACRPGHWQFYTGTFGRDHWLSLAFNTQEPLPSVEVLKWEGDGFTPKERWTYDSIG